MLLNSNHASSVIDHALSLGADFCDIFVEKRYMQNVKILSSQVNAINSGIEFGIGIRLVYGSNAVYGYTNHTNLEELIKITTTLASLDKRNPVNTATALNFTKTFNLHPSQIPLDKDLPLEEKVKYLLQIDKGARELNTKINQMAVSSLQWQQHVEIFNSEGLQVTDTRPYTRIVATAIASDGSNQSSASESPGALKGWEHTSLINPQMLGEDLAKRAVKKLTAQACPAGNMPVILGNAFGGVIFHEACGHLLETTAVAKKSSVFHDKMGEQIASSLVSAVDDGTIPNAWGSINIDDEGMPAQKTQLIKDGVLTSFMVDKLGAMKTGFLRTGSGRKQNYKFAPASRMRNTFIESGNHKLEDMIASIDYGIYAEKMGGGSVTPGTGDFNFSANEAYLIEKGKITTPLKSASLIGTGPDILNKISMVSNNFKIAAGTCGSISGNIPASVGQPAIKVDNILVGGQK